MIVPTELKEPQDWKNDSSWSEREWAVEYNTENRIQKIWICSKVMRFFSTSSHLLKSLKVRVTINRFLAQNALFYDVIKGIETLIKILNPNNLVFLAWIVKFNLKK